MISKEERQIFCLILIIECMITERKTEGQFIWLGIIFPRRMNFCLHLISDFSYKKIPEKNENYLILHFQMKKCDIFNLKPFFKILFLFLYVILFPSGKLDCLNIKMKICQSYVFLVYLQSDHHTSYNNQLKMRDIGSQKLQLPRSLNFAKLFSSMHMSD